MVECPVCGTENEPDLPNCRNCHLASSLFEPVREAAGPGQGDTDYTRVIAEILAGAGLEVSPDEATTAGTTDLQAVVLRPARFPSAGAALAPLPLPELPPPAMGAGLTPVQRQIDELFQIGRRQGLDLRDWEQKTQDALAAEDRPGLEVVRRSLFAQLAAALGEDYEVLMGRRNELTALVPTATADTELSSGRSALAAGDLPGAQRRLRQVAEGLSELEERWATCQILVAEADLMIQTLVELGGDAGPARGPLEEGRRLARAGETSRAERMLAGANRAIWELLAPRLTAGLRAIREQLAGLPQGGEPMAAIARELRELAALLRRRNFGAAINAYRRLRETAQRAHPPKAD